MVKKKVIKIPGELPRLPAPEMLQMSPIAAVPYVKHGIRRCGLSDELIATIIKRYRDGAGILTLSKELDITEETVKRWLYRAEEVHVLRVRRKTDDLNEKHVAKRHAAEERILQKKEEAADADLELSQKLRGVIDMILKKLTPEKADKAKFKDLVDALVKLIEKDRLLLNKSTANTTQSVVQYIAHLNAMPMAQRIQLAQATLVSHTPALPAPEEAN